MVSVAVKCSKLLRPALWRDTSQIGVLHQRFGVARVARIHGDADAGRKPNLARLADGERFGHRREHFARDGVGVGAAREIGRNDDELVAAQASYEIIVPNAAPHARRRPARCDPRQQPELGARFSPRSAARLTTSRRLSRKDARFGKSVSAS